MANPADQACVLRTALRNPSLAIARHGNTVGHRSSPTSSYQRCKFRTLIVTKDCGEAKWMGFVARNIAVFGLDFPICICICIFISSIHAAYPAWALGRASHPSSATAIFCGSPPCTAHLPPGLAQGSEVLLQTVNTRRVVGRVTECS